MDVDVLVEEVFIEFEWPIGIFGAIFCVNSRFLGSKGTYPPALEVALTLVAAAGYCCSFWCSWGGAGF